MFICAQLNENDVVQTVAILAGPVEGTNIIPVPEWDDNLLGMKYDRDGNRFYRLAAEIDGEARVNEPVNVMVSWRDQAGAVVVDAEQVTASCAGVETEVIMQDGRGEFQFIPESPGTYTITVRSESGVETQLEVVAE